MSGDLQDAMRSTAKSAAVRGETRVKPLRGSLRAITREIERLDQIDQSELLPCAVWLLDNGRFLQEEAASLRQDVARLPRLPKVIGGEARILLLANEYVRITRADFSVGTLTSAVAIWQEARALTQGELCALPTALRLSLMSVVLDRLQKVAERQRDALRAGECMAALRRNPENAQALYQKYGDSAAFLARLCALARESEDEDALRRLGALLAARKLTAENVLAIERETQTENAAWLSGAITALRAVQKAPWHRLTEDMSLLDRALRGDPAQIYPKMDEESRAAYRAEAARLARLAGWSEEALVDRALSLARGQEDELKRHVGYYLLDAGRGELLSGENRLPFRARLWIFVKRRALTLYRMAHWLAFLLLLLLCPACGLSCWVALPFALTFLTSARLIARAALKRLCPPKLVPRMAIDRLSRAQRTLVVCPTLLEDGEQALKMVKNLFILQQANPDPRLHFLLLGDYADSVTGTQQRDQEIVWTASRAVDSLRADSGGAFFYMQRARKWNAADHIHGSRERKRGGLETLMKLICGMEIEDEYDYATRPPESLSGQYRYVITLDSDTFLPPGSALRLIGAMEHPLQKRRELDGRMRGVSILQPRMETAAHTVSTWLGRHLGGAGGTDPYHALSADLMQDCFSRGSFVGKGILDPQAFLQGTLNKIMPLSVLSHDLLEGELAGCKLASDIVFYDGQPATLRGYLMRLHRWTRGDWQLLPYALWLPKIGARAPKAGLDTLAKHKILDNLQRSLLPACKLALLSYAVGAGKPLLLIAVLLSDELFALRAPAGVLLRLCALPGETAITLDAIGRALYRMFVSRKKLLEWTTAAQTARQQGARVPMTVYFGAGAGAVMAACALLPAGALTSAGIALAGLFALFPLALPPLEQPEKRAKPLQEHAREELRALAKETYLFFEATVTREENHLPPDNLQLEPDKGAARRTSPTNIGLYLLSLIAAQKLELIGAQDMADRMANTVSTLEKLPLWHGLPYNWYDTRTLTALPPSFVSSVDCGNLAACLLAAAQGLRVLLPELTDKQRALPARLDALAYHMALDRLYDPDAELFYIGVSGSDGAPTREHYDLLASEARLLSYTAIMLSKAPVKHWSRLSRRMTRTRRGKTLASYSGTMFEYLMPQLFLPAVKDTLLSTACSRAMREQMALRKAPAWGVSESGYYAFDSALNYQYRAFGVPALALDPAPSRLVIAPYASMLALPFYPKEALRNLTRMRSSGWEGRYGLFEAADLSQGEAKLVRSHMAHHQGMILLSVCNALCENHIVSLFSSLPRAMAHALLLEERFPRGAKVIRRPLKRRRQPGALTQYQFSRAADPLFFPVDAHLLGGGGATLLIDAQGGGYLQKDGVMLSRFRESCALPGGMRYYIRDSRSGRAVMATDPLVDGQTRFESAQAVFTRRWDELEWTLRLFVSPLDGAQLALMTIKNLRDSDRMLEACSYMELALAPLRDDLAHPSFQNLFISTKRAGSLGVLATHRPRERGQAPVSVAHGLSLQAQPMSALLTTDRLTFLGRNRTLYQPEALERPISASKDTLGSVIEPCLSVRAQFALPARSETSLVFATGAIRDGEAPEAFLAKHLSLESAEKTYGLALTKSLVASRSLSLEAEEQKLISRLIGCLSYTDQPHQQTGSDVTLPLCELWSMGISGDLPILTLTAAPDGETRTARLLCKAHALYQECGFAMDLVFLCPGGSAPLMERIASLARAQRGGEAIGKSGGVHLIDMDGVGQRKVALLKRMARLDLIAGEPIAKQLEKLLLGVRHGEQNAQPVICKDMPKSAGELTCDNGFGGFDEAGDYLIRLPCGTQTPAPWSNMLSSPLLGSLATESGVAFSYYQNSHQGRLTRWPSDSASLYSGENFYLIDDEKRLCWSGTRWPLGEGVGYLVKHGAGYTQYDSLPYGLSARLTVFTDSELPLLVRTLMLRNKSQEKRMIRYCHAVSFTLGVGAQTRLTRATVADGAVFTMNPSMTGVGCLAPLSEAPKQALCTSEGAFFGLFGRIPIALCPGNALLPGEGSMGVLEYEITLMPGESATISTALGFSENREALSMALRTAADGVSKRLHLCKLFWEERLGGLQFHLPDRALELMLNRYLPYQVYAARLFARAGFYQAGGAYGFRDQLQDLLALLWTNGSAAREHIVRCAEHQFIEGDVQHWWHPERLGVRTRITDDRLFLPYLTAKYVEITGDASILPEQIQYLDQPPLAPSEKESVQAPGLTQETESLLLHGLRAIGSEDFGQKGLLKMGGGDWNDGMNRVGGENGESVWLSMFYCEAIRLFAPLCDQKASEKLLLRRAEVMGALENSAWDGAWYLRAWFDSGAPLGSSRSEECRVDALPQSWAALCGLDENRCRIALDSLWRLLYDPQNGILKLFTPAFDGRTDPGYIAGYLPGVRENGGQYTHAAPWAVMALHQLGMDRRAWSLANSLMPYTHADTREKALRYRVEPYVTAGDVYAAQGQEGRGGWSWYTGSAAWLYYAVIGCLFGFKKRGDSLSLSPVLPEGWDGMALTYRHGGATYHITAKPDCASPVLDGQPLPGGAIPLKDDGRIHEATFQAFLAGGDAP